MSYARYNGLTGSGGGGSGVSSLNGETGAVNIVAGTGITVTPAGQNITIAATGGGSGTVTSVALALPGSLFTVTGSPVTTSGTLTVSFTNQTANTVFAGPATGSPAVPTFRALVSADIAGDPNSVAFFDNAGTLSDDPDVGYFPTITQTFPPFAAKGFYADSDSINLQATGLIFGSTDTATDSFTTNLGIITGCNNTVGAANPTGGIILSTGEILDATATAETGALNLQTGNNAGGSSGGLTLMTGETNAGPSGAVVIKSGEGFTSGDSGNVQFASGPANTGQSGNVEVSSGTSANDITGNINIQTGAALATSSGGITAVTGNSVEDSGEVEFRSGDVSGFTFQSGNLSFSSGGTTDGLSGGLFFQSGASATGNTGNVVFQSGVSATGSGNSGSYQVNSGNVDAGNSGLLSLFTGTSTSGNSGVIDIISGNAGANTGALNIKSGNSTTVGNSGILTFESGDATSGNSGDLVFETGTASGTRGQLQFLDGTEGTAGWVWTSTDTAGHGAWIASGGGGGANTALSNLAAVAINQDLTPGTSGTLNIGSTTEEWAQLYCVEAHDPSDVISISFDGRALYRGGGGVSADWNNGNLYDSTGAQPTVAYFAQQLIDDTGVIALTWLNGTRNLLDEATNLALDWTSRQLSNGTTSLLDWSASDINVTSANLQISTLGKGLQVKTGTNSKLGTAVLVGGTVTVSNTSVTANSRIFLTSQVDGGTVGFLRITAKTNGTSFVITSSSILDTSTVAWMIVESIP